MKQDILLEKLNEKIDRISSLRSTPRFSPQFKKWHRETEVLLVRGFGKDAYQLNDFKSIDFLYRGGHRMGDSAPFDRRFYGALEEASAILTSIKEEIFEFGLDSSYGAIQNPIAVVEHLCSRFHTVVRQLRIRHSGRTTLDVEDEYDVQDLLHSLLRIHFSDVRPEEWTPSYGGSSARMDFLLKPERVVIEVKMTRKSMTVKDLVDQLIIDRGRYENHPDCENLVCFVYDPDGRIGNTVAIKSDIESTQTNLPVRVLIYPTNE